MVYAIVCRGTADELVTGQTMIAFFWSEFLGGWTFLLLLSDFAEYTVRMPWILTFLPLLVSTSDLVPLAFVKIFLWGSFEMGLCLDLAEQSRKTHFGPFQFFRQ